MKNKIRTERSGKVLKHQRDELVAECHKRGININRKNLTVKQQISRLKDRIKTIKEAPVTEQKEEVKNQ